MHEHIVKSYAGGCSTLIDARPKGDDTGSTLISKE